MNVPFSTEWRRRTPRDFGQLIEDPAMLGFLTAQAGFTQAFELLFQLAQLPDTFSNMADVLVQKLIDFKAVFSWRVFESQ